MIKLTSKDAADKMKDHQRGAAAAEPDPAFCCGNRRGIPARVGGLHACSAGLDPAEPGAVPRRDFDGFLGEYAAFGDHRDPGRGQPVRMGRGYCVYAVYPEKRAILH